MFWRFGGYANVSTIDTILDKPDVSLEEVLDESDLIQELKQHNSKLIEYLRDENVLHRLLGYVVTPPLIGDDDENWEEENEDEEDEPERKSISPLRSLSIGRSKENKTVRQEEREDRENKEKTRQKYAYVSSEVLSSETWSIIEALMENQTYLRNFWGFIRREPPLDPVTAGYFTKINETLLDKKTEETLEFVKSLEGIVPAMLRHVDCPMVMDLLLKIISMEKAEGGQGIVDWLQCQNLIPLLLAFLGEEYATFTQTSAGDFIKAIITISANASQNEQSCIGPNSLTRQLVSEQCIEAMVTDMLKGGNPLTVGVGIIIEVIRKNNSDYDPEISMGNELPPSTSDPIYLGTLLRLFAKHVPDFTSLILSPNHTVSKGEDTVTEKRKDLEVAFGNAIEPLGFDRFKTCELMAELLHCSNMGLLNERGSEDYIRQRDKERELLKAEGALAKSREPQSAVTEFSEDGSTFNVGEGSPKEMRKLEVTNSAEDDGFEDVGASADINEEIKEGEPIKRSTSRVSLEDEFVDEPLSSPKQYSTPKSPSNDLDAEPESPTSALASGVNDVHIGGDGQSSSTEASQEPSKSTADDLVNEIEAQLSPSATNPDAPPLPKRDNLTASNGADPAGGVSPNEEDKPAPLFASRVEEQSQPQTQTTDQQQPSNPDSDPQNAGQEMPFIHRLEIDVDGEPIVGDYLKMQFVEHKVVPTILDFFFRFPWNNFLHNVVYDVVQQVFNGPMDRGYNRNLAFDLFQTGRITDRIIEGQLKSDEVTAQNNMRLGYMGHLTLVAEEVVKFSERHPPEMLSEVVLDYLTSKLWSDYVENTLSETRDRDNAILGGVRPDMAVGPRQAVLNAVNAATGFGNTGSNALVNAGLNGGGTGLDSMDLSSNGQSNFLSGGSLLSGFGSSSDEEDEEMEEIGEQEEGGAGSGESNSDQYPSYTPTSLSALSIFSTQTTTSEPADQSSPSQPPTISTTTTSTPTPPTNPPPSIPPPLNIPPSRARRQLQARLALSKERAEKQAAGRASPGASPGSSPTGSFPTGSSPTGSSPTGSSPRRGSNSPSMDPAADSLDKLLHSAGSEEAVSEALRRADRQRAIRLREGDGLGVTVDEAWGVGGAGGAGARSGGGGRSGGVAEGAGAGAREGSGSGLGAAFEPAMGGVGGWDEGSSEESSSEDGEETPGSGVDSLEGERGNNEGEGEEGEDVPLRISTSPRTMPLGVVGRMKALFSSGGGGSEDGNSSDDEVVAGVKGAKETKGMREGGDEGSKGEELKRASVRKAIDEE